CDLPIGGGRGYSTDANVQKLQIDGFATRTGLSKERLQILYARYGTRTETVAAFIKRATDTPLKSLPDYSRREIAFLAQSEKALHLDDILLRRTMLAMLGRLTRDNVKELGEAMGVALGWSVEQKTAEVERTLRLLADRHGLGL
ncbi:MAG: glycerol-3-phosphate dehydrogenase C-terminal domain-containing protein, partial [Anaerolineales bacterium]|nr:glycerol-3-phosphate dehydrogenase C-terminal domain-containing protein [Anaerolineales bacterium]